MDETRRLSTAIMYTGLDASLLVEFSEWLSLLGDLPLSSLCDLFLINCFGTPPQLPHLHQGPPLLKHAPQGSDWSIYTKTYTYFRFIYLWVSLIHIAHGVWLDNYDFHRNHVYRLKGFFTGRLVRMNFFCPWPSYEFFMWSFSDQLLRHPSPTSSSAPGPSPT